MPRTKKQLLFLLAGTFFVKFALGLYFSHLAVCQYPGKQFGFIAVDSGDTFSYLGAMDNLLEQGKYFFWNGKRDVYAGRMPFYGAPYFLLRLFLSKSAAGDALVVLQIFCDALATIFFARLCFLASPHKSVFWIAYGVYFCSFNSFFSSVLLSADSLSLSLLVFFLYFYQRFWTTQNWSDAVSAGFLLALMTVFKPYLVILYPAFFLGVILRGKTFDFSAAAFYLRRTIVLSLPLLVLLAPWIARNAIVLGKFIPAQENVYAGYGYSDAFIALTEFTGAWGGDAGAWDATEAGCYFTANPPAGCDFVIPQRALTDRYDAADFERVRQSYLELEAHYSPELDKKAAAEFERLTEIYRQEKPFMYYVGSKFFFLKKLFWHTGNYSLPINPALECYRPFQMLFKIVQFIIYALALTLGVVGLIKLFYERKIGFLFLAIPVIIAVFFAEIKTAERRYTGQVYTILLLGTPTAFLALYNLLKLYCYKLRRRNVKPV